MPNKHSQFFLLWPDKSTLLAQNFWICNRNSLRRIPSCGILCTKRAISG